MASLHLAIPDPDALVSTVSAFSTSSGSSIHGEQHWQTVAAFGTVLALQTPGADPPVDVAQDLPVSLAEARSRHVSWHSPGLS
jgi:hypothetical protein